MKKLSTGQDSTLENWIALSTAAFGTESKATEFLKERSEASPNGLQEEVIADERQLIGVLINLHKHE
jgi:hypothetical protein